MWCNLLLATYKPSLHLPIFMEVIAHMEKKKSVINKYVLD